MHVRWVIALVFVSLSFSRPVRAQFTLVNVGHATNYPNGFAYGISVVGNYAYLANGSGDGLRIFDVSDPAKPVSIGQTNVTGDLTRVIVSNNRAYVDASGLKIYDVSDPANPSFLGGGTNSDVFLHAVSGNHAFLVSDYGGATFALRTSLLDLANLRRLQSDRSILYRLHQHRSLFVRCGDRRQLRLPGRLVLECVHAHGDL